MTQRKIYMFNKHIMDFVHRTLHPFAKNLCHYTAPVPITITPVVPAERDIINEYKLKLLEGKDLLLNQDGSKNTGKKKTIETILDNTITQMKSQKDMMELFARSGPDGNRDVILPLVRNVAANLIANEIMGVQAITGPVGQIHTLRVRYAQSQEEIDTLNDATKTEFEKATAVLEGKGGNRLSIQIMREVVEANTIKYGARWSFSDSEVGDVEITKALEQEMICEIDQEHLKSLNELIGPATMSYDQGIVSGTPTFVGDLHAALAIFINRAANLIAARTRRGAGNWCVVSPTALTILQSATTSAFARKSDWNETPKSSASIRYVGTLNNALRVYCNQYAADSTDILVGYRGNDIDAGAYYVPYLPVVSSGVIIDPKNFEPCVTFTRKDGFVVLRNSASSLGNGSDYFSKVGINVENLSFI